MDVATSPENLAGLQVWTPEQQARELTRRFQLIIESYSPFTPKPSDVIVPGRSAEERYDVVAPHLSPDPYARSRARLRTPAS